MACVDVKLFHSYIVAVLSMFTSSHDGEKCHTICFRGMTLQSRDFRFGAELCFLGIIYIYSLSQCLAADN